MDKKYNHQIVEKGKNQKWIDKKYFSKHDSSKKPFSILLPPPNITGKLHLGHAWDTMIQDSLIRFKKLQGYDTFWIAGMDHAGISTQAKVEEKLRENNLPGRHDLGREQFLKKVWEWKDEYASIIREQWGVLGLAIDYSNERFTMDKGLSIAVQKVFIDLYKRKLIYRGEKPINWDTKLQTVLSNIEVENKDTEQLMYYIDYNLKNGGKVTIATVRIETLFSDRAIAINPNDEKMSHLIGKIAINPLTKKELPIIADSYIEIGKGTGAMKVSAHADADYKILQDNNLEVVECIDKNGNMNENAMEFLGLDRFEARKKIAEKLKNENKISKVEKVISPVGYSERSGDPIEILVQPQWFVKMKPMAEKIINDLNGESGVKFYPSRFKETLINWMNKIQDWCISRQLWWGHRMPVWYKNDEIQVQADSPGKDWTQEKDVLDTWFSSGIAPFSFLGWPDNKKMLHRYYPTSVLVTGYDIIFFWVARMYFQGLDVMKQKPFNNVLIHGLIRDNDGKKMSKSLGNGIDPMNVVEKYGSDSLRWFLLTNSSPGQDIRYSDQKLEAAWNLSNKLWNISRYILDVMEEKDTDPTPADKWIISKLIKLEKLIISKMEKYEFTIIGKELLSFITDDFSSWYIEFTKATPNKKIAKIVLEKLLIIAHPFLPNITDHIFNMIDGKELLEQSLVETKSIGQADYIEEVIEIVKAIRTFREEKQISLKQVIEFHSTKNLSLEIQKMIKNLSNAILVDNGDATIKLNNFEISIRLSEQLKQSENDRIKKKIEFLEKEISRAKSILNNENFIKKAPKEKVNDEKKKLEKYENELNSLKGNNLCQ